eukprot:414919_1
MTVMQYNFLTSVLSMSEETVNSHADVLRSRLRQMRQVYGMDGHRKVYIRNRSPQIRRNRHNTQVLDININTQVSPASQLDSQVSQVFAHNIHSNNDNNNNNSNNNNN